MDLYIIAGPANTGKMPLARAILEKRQDMTLVHRDLIRSALLGAAIAEDQLTLIMRDIVNALLQEERSVLVCAQNLHPHDKEVWDQFPRRYNIARYSWWDTREADVQKLIPAMDDKRRAQWGV